MRKILPLIFLVLLSACNNDTAVSNLVSSQPLANTDETPKCVKGPFKNKEELAQLLTSRVYGQSQDVALSVLGRPSNVDDLQTGRQAWNYQENYCSEPDKITGKPTVIASFSIIIDKNKLVAVSNSPLSDIHAFSY